jgi:hypothetical protein
MCDYKDASRALTYSLIVGGIVSNGKGAPHMLLLTVNNMREVNVMDAVGNGNATNSHAAVPLAQSAIQRFDVAVGNYKYGELKVDMETAEFVANANAGKRLADEQVTLAAVKNETILHRIAIAHSTVKNSGWVHFEGTLTAAQIDWIHANGDNAWFGLVLQRIYPPLL